MNRYVAAVDWGTSGVRCAIFDLTGRQISFGFEPIETLYAKPGWAEQVAPAVVEAAYKAVRQAVDREGVDAAEIAALSFDTIRTTFVPVDRQGNYLSNILIWQDQRGVDCVPWMHDRLAEHGVSDRAFYMRTAHPLNPQQCGTKAVWFHQNCPELYDKTYKFATPQAILARTFGAEDWVDQDNDNNWWLVTNGDSFEIDPELCRWFDLDPDKYLKTCKSGSCVGQVSEAAARRTGLKKGTPLFVGSGDSQCGAVGVGNSGTMGVGSISLGTGGTCIGYSAQPMRDSGCVCGISGHPAGGYIIEGMSFAAAGAFRWLRDAIGQHESELALRSGRDVYDLLTEAAAQSPAGARGVFFLPHLAGVASHYDQNARGAMIGMTLDSKKSDLIRAAMEGICFETRDILEIMKTAGKLRFDRLRLTGGVAKSALWNQIQADVYGCPVETVEVSEAASLGAAMIGAVGVGLFRDLNEASEHMVRVKDRYEPQPACTKQYDEIFGIWQSCYEGLAREAFPRIGRYQSR